MRRTNGETLITGGPKNGGRTEDLSGTEIACLDTVENVSCYNKLCRSTSTYEWNDTGFGDTWLHRLSIDSVTNARCEFQPDVANDNWDDVEDDIEDFEDEDTFDNTMQAYGERRACLGYMMRSWTEDWDPKRHKQRQSIDWFTSSDQTWTFESAGTRETRIQVNDFKIEERFDNYKLRTIRGQGVLWCVCQCPAVDVRSFVVDAIGNYEGVGGTFYEVALPPNSTFSTFPPRTWFTATPSPATTTFPPTTQPLNRETELPEQPEPDPEVTYTIPPPTPTEGRGKSIEPVETLKPESSASPENTKKKNPS